MLLSVFCDKTPITKTLTSPATFSTTNMPANRPARRGNRSQNMPQYDPSNATINSIRGTVSFICEHPESRVSGRQKQAIHISECFSPTTSFTDQNLKIDHPANYPSSNKRPRTDAPIRFQIRLPEHHSNQNTPNAEGIAIVQPNCQGSAGALFMGWVRQFDANIIRGKLEAGNILVGNVSECIVFDWSGRVCCAGQIKFFDVTIGLGLPEGHIDRGLFNIETSFYMESNKCTVKAEVMTQLSDLQSMLTNILVE